MLKLYKMPNGRKYWFEDGMVPESAVLVESEIKEEKAVEPVENKAVKPANKARKKAADK